MSTKFRKSFLLLCDDCRRSTKGQRSGAIFFYKEYNVRQVIGANGLAVGRTNSTTGKVSYQQPHASQFQEKKSLLADNPPITELPVNATNFIFPERFT
jgi:hypothetical protein